MKTIEVDDDVYWELERKAVGFDATPNSVLRGLLGLPLAPREVAAAVPALALPPEDLRAFGPLRAARKAVDVYAAIFSWLYQKHSDRFTDLERFLNKTRSYIGRDPEAIKSSGRGVHVAAVPNSPLWLMVTLDNNQKRRVMADALVFLGYTEPQTSVVLSLLPVSAAGSRSRTRSALEPSDSGPLTGPTAHEDASPTRGI